MSYNPENRTALTKPGRFVAAYSHKADVFLIFPEDSEFTRQEFKDECDINTIMAQYQSNGGQIFHINEMTPQYMDCTAATFREQMDFVAGAYSMFEELPSKIREQFDNDPAEFLDFCSQEKNRPEMAQMGLLSPTAVDRMVTEQNELAKLRAASQQPTAPSAPTPADQV